MATYEISLKKRRVRATTEKPLIINKDYKVKSNTPVTIEDITNDVIYGPTEVPAPYERLCAFSSYQCSEVDAKADASASCFWDISTKFKILEVSSKDVNSPLDEPADISYSSKKYKVPAVHAYSRAVKKYDSNGDFTPQPFAIDLGTTEDGAKYPVTNTLGRRFEEQPVKIKRNPVINIRRNERELYFDPERIDDYIDTINYKDITIAGRRIKAGTGKINNISANRQYYRNEDGDYQLYFSVKYEIEIDPQGQFGIFLNADKVGRDKNGKLCVLYENREKIPIEKIKNSGGDGPTSEEGEENVVDKPQKLDIDGKPIWDEYEGSDILHRATQERVDIYYQLQPAKDWHLLAFPVRKDGFS